MDFLWDLIEFTPLLLVGVFYLLFFFKNALSPRAKKVIVIIALVVIALGIIVSTLSDWYEESDNPFDYARITHVDYKAVVTDEYDGYGKVVITEKLTFDVHAASSSPDGLFWELWRDLPEYSVDGALVNYYVRSVKEIKPDGTAVEWERAERLYWDDWEFTRAAAAAGYGPGKWWHSIGPYNPDAQQYECLLFYVDGLYREKITFEIEYVMYNAAIRYADSSELWLSIYSEGMAKYLESLKAQILVPLEIMPREGNYTANTYGTNSHTFPYTESTAINPGYHTFSFELDKNQLKFRPYNMYIEFTLVSFGEDKHIFTQNASVNTYYNSNKLQEIFNEQAKYEALPGQYLTVKIIVFVCLTAGTGLVIWIIAGTDKRLRKKHNFYKSDYDIKYFMEIPGNLDPNFAAYLAFCKHKLPQSAAEDGYSAVMLSLARKGYIELDRMYVNKGWEPDNMKIVVRHNPAPQPVAAQTQGLYCTVCGKYNALDIKNSMCCAYCGKPILLNEPNTAAQHMQQTAGQTVQQVMTEAEAPRLEQLTRTEALFFNLIMRHSHGQEIALNTFQNKVKSDYEYTSSFVQNMKDAATQIGVSDGYFGPGYNKLYKNVRARGYFWAIAGCVIVTLGNLISYQTRVDLAFGAYFIAGIGLMSAAVYLMTISRRYFLLTQLGENEYVKWRALYNFLNDEALMKERIVPDLVIWEKYLVYATAFGIAEKVTKVLELKCAQMNVNVNNSVVLRNPYYRSRYFYSHHRFGSRSFGSSFGSATRSAVTHSTASGGHGGYGGGGRGGGGGGGGH